MPRLRVNIIPLNFFTTTGQTFQGKEFDNSIHVLSSGIQIIHFVSFQLILSMQGKVFSRQHFEIFLFPRK